MPAGPWSFAFAKSLLISENKHDCGIEIERAIEVFDADENVREQDASLL